MVSWPATSRVMSSSRSSWSDMPRPSSSRAWISIESTSSRSSRSGAARRRRISSNSSSSAGSMTCRKARTRDSRCGPITAIMAMRRGSEPQESTSRRASSNRRRRVVSVTPNTVRITTSSVIACMRGHTFRGRPARPAGHLALGDLGHRLPVAAHPLAVERGEHELALRHVRLLVQEEHGVAAEEREQHHVGLAGVQKARVAGEHLLHRVGVGQEHPGALVHDPQGEHVPVAPPAALHHGRGPHDPLDALDRLRCGGPRGQARRCGHGGSSTGPCPHRRCRWSTRR